MSTISEKVSADKPRVVVSSLKEGSTSTKRPSVPSSVIVRNYVLTSLPLAGSDIAGVLFSVLVGSGTLSIISGVGLMAYVPMLLAVVLVSFAVAELYPAVGIDPVIELRRCVCAFAVPTLCLMVCSVWMFTSWSLLLGWLIVLCAGMVAIPLGRMFVRGAFRRIGWWGQPIVVVQHPTDLTGEAADYLARKSGFGLRPVYWDGKTNLLDFASLEGADRVLVDEASYPHAYRDFRNAFAHVHVLRRHDGEFPVLWPHIEHRPACFEYRYLNRLRLPGWQAMKRVIDVTLILLSLPLLAPLMFVLTIAVKRSSEGEVFYTQERLGQYGIPFRAWKFRTMVQDAEALLDDYLEANPELREEWNETHKLQSDPRVTSIGDFLRKTSLDELPQIWNVLAGQMSLSGPRPIPMYEVADYDAVHPEALHLYEEVLPGLTGLWQISGRNNTTYTERVAYDRHYVRNWSLWLDLYIILRTIKTVILREGSC